MTNRTKAAIARFWANVDTSGGPDACWLWTGNTHKGYGIIAVHRTRGSHRVSYELANGPIPEGLHVLHACDNRRCVNPVHLSLGTNAENCLDRKLKGRGADKRGEKHHLARLTNADVLEIRRTARPGNHASIAERFGISRKYVSDIVHKQRWAHV